MLSPSVLWVGCACAPWENRLPWVSLDTKEGFGSRVRSSVLGESMFGHSKVSAFLGLFSLWKHDPLQSWSGTDIAQTSWY